MTSQSIDDATIARIAEIARLKLSSEEQQRFRKDANEILDFFAKINDLEERGSELYYLREADNPLREDSARASDASSSIRSQFSQPGSNGLMKAPKNL